MCRASECYASQYLPDYSEAYKAHLVRAYKEYGYLAQAPTERMMEVYHRYWREFAFEVYGVGLSCAACRGSGAAACGCVVPVSHSSVDVKVEGIGQDGELGEASADTAGAGVVGEDRVMDDVSKEMEEVMII